MRRILIGCGTALGNQLSATGAFSECLTFARAVRGFAPAHEIVVVCPRPGDGRAMRFTRTALAHALEGKAKRLIALSSIDAYPTKSLPFDERTIINPTASSHGATPPWTELRRFELALSDLAAHVTILRLPEVFGPGFIRGVASHLLDKNVSRANRVAIHQWYPAHRLERDLVIARYSRAPIINLVSEPLAMGTILDELFPAHVGEVSTPAPYSRISSVHAEAFGGGRGYIMSAASVIDELKTYVLSGRKLRGSPRLSVVPKPVAALVVAKDAVAARSQPFA